MMGSKEVKNPLMPDDMEDLTFTESTLDDFRSTMASFTSSNGALPVSDPLSTSKFRVDYDTELPPPSYQEVVGAGSSGGGYGGVGGESQIPGGYGYSSISSSSGVSSGGASRKGPGRTEKLDIRVLEPQKVQDSGSSIVPGGGGYVTYSIVTETNMPEYAANHLTTRRRFRDFVTLADRLTTQYRGYFIPPRPDKEVVEGVVVSTGKEFVEKRRVALDRYLHRLAAHPVIRKSNDLRIFLETEGQLPFPAANDMASRIFGSADGGGSLSESVRGVRGEGAKSGGRDFFRMFKEMRQSVTNDWTRGGGGGRGGGGSGVFREEGEGGGVGKAFERRLFTGDVSGGREGRGGEVVGPIGDDVSETVAVRGSFFFRAPGGGGVRRQMGAPGGGGTPPGPTTEMQRHQGYDDKRIADSSLQASRTEGLCVQKTRASLVTLTDYCELMPALHAAFGERQSAMVSLQTVGGEVAGMKEKLGKMEEAAKKVLGGDKARVDKAKEEIQRMEYVKGEEEKEYEKLKERNLSELLRFEEERWRDLYAMLHGFVGSQIECADALEKIWTTAAEGFERTKSMRENSAQQRGGAGGEGSASQPFE